MPVIKELQASSFESCRIWLVLSCSTTTLMGVQLYFVLFLFFTSLCFYVSIEYFCQQGYINNYILAMLKKSCAQNTSLSIDVLCTKWLSLPVSSPLLKASQPNIESNSRISWIMRVYKEPEEVNTAKTPQGWAMLSSVLANIRYPVSLLVLQY